MGCAAFLRRPVHERLLFWLKRSGKLFADETTAPVLDLGYPRDDRPWSASDPPGVAYLYAPGRKTERPLADLIGFKGVLQVDGHAGHRAPFADRGDVALAFCWSHVRRRFFEPHRREPGADRERGAGAHRGAIDDREDIRCRSADDFHTLSDTVLPCMRRRAS